MSIINNEFNSKIGYTAQKIRIPERSGKMVEKFKHEKEKNRSCPCKQKNVRGTLTAMSAADITKKQKGNCRAKRINLLKIKHLPTFFNVMLLRFNEPESKLHRLLSCAGAYVYTGYKLMYSLNAAAENYACGVP